MLQARAPVQSGKIERPTAYSRFDAKARNAWLDNLERKIQRALHPRPSPGPSRSPSPFEVTIDAPLKAPSPISEAGDELFGDDLLKGAAFIDEGELLELEDEFRTPG